MISNYLKLFSDLVILVDLDLSRFKIHENLVRSIIYKKKHLRILHQYLARQIMSQSFIDGLNPCTICSIYEFVV